MIDKSGFCHVSDGSGDCYRKKMANRKSVCPWETDHWRNFTIRPDMKFRDLPFFKAVSVERLKMHIGIDFESVSKHSRKIFHMRNGLCQNETFGRPN
ncbi:hypothetical protein TNCV_674271 [Trichonephila clavipes]|nr:hypothetical protein TNCV_674271 [Trichonephila clavipes]